MAVTTTRRQAVDRGLDGAAEVRRDDQGGQVRVLVERLLMRLEELGPDGAATVPDALYQAVV